MKRLLALFLCCTMLLSGCKFLREIKDMYDVVHFEEMVYTRPDMDQLGASAQAAIEAAEENRSADVILDAVMDYYEVYDTFTTNYNLSYIHYHADMNDDYWQQELDYCSQNLAQLDAYLEDIYRAIADCDARQELEEEYFGEGWFDDYTGESFYDEELVALMGQEQTLVADYYDLVNESGEDQTQWLDEYAMPAAQILVELIQVRQRIAQRAGYASYPDFAWDCYYYRDYTTAQAEAYLGQIREKLVPVYRQMHMTDVWDYAGRWCYEWEVFEYVEDTAEAMGGTTEDAFLLLEQAELYDISASGSKSGLSFELYLQDYYQPYVFVSGTGTQYDCLSFAHEFGHFANDYASGGSIAGTDVLEVFSQGMEYLSLCYADANQRLIDVKLADSLCTYVEQSAYADFERQMYSLSGQELTAENLLALYEEVCRGYGFDCWDWDPRDMATVPHFYGNPMYVISYVVSNDAAMQLYQMELDNSGAGKKFFEKNLDTEEAGLMAFLDSAGLQSPFNRVDAVRALMEQHFGTDDP